MMAFQMAESLGIVLPLSEEDLNSYVKDIRNYAVSHTLIARVKSKDVYGKLAEDGQVLDVNERMAMIPTVISSATMKRIKEVQVPFLSLYIDAAHDSIFLEKYFQGTVEADEFMANIWKIHLETKNQKDHRCLTLCRNDFMLGTADCMKQIEINLMAVGNAHAASKLGKYSRYMVHKIGKVDVDKDVQFEFGKPRKAFALALRDAWVKYGNKDAVIIVLINDDPVVYSIHDQLSVQYELLSLDKNIKTLRKTFKDLRESRLDENNNLFLGDLEIALVYFRTGFSPETYESEDWTVRMNLETSNAIMCPCIHTMLINTKKAQQVLSSETMLQKYISDDEMVEKMSDTFVKQYVLDDVVNGESVIDLAINNPSQFVLKPQREGGGNNKFDQEMVEVLKKISKSNEWKRYILMERICPRTVWNYIIARMHGVNYCEVFNELGFFTSCMLDRTGKTMENCGSICETKSINSNLNSNYLNAWNSVVVKKDN